MAQEVAKLDPRDLERTPAAPAMTPMAMLDRAIASGAGVEVLEKLMALQERWDANQARKAFDAAMAALRQELPAIVKSREVDFTTSKGRTHYRYEDLNAVTEAVSPVMARHGLSFRWRTDTSAQGTVSVTCIISHRDGHAEETTLSAGHDHSGNKNNIQAIGSAVTYLQRYTLKAALGVAAAPDDDGRLAGSGNGNGGFISDDDLIELEERIEALKADRKKLCQYLRVDSLASLPAGRLKDAHAALDKKAAAEKAKEPSNG